jgi:hypothetical protein
MVVDRGPVRHGVALTTVVGFEVPPHGGRSSLTHVRELVDKTFLP